MGLSKLLVLAWGLVIGSYVLATVLWFTPEWQEFGNVWFRG